MNQSRESIPPQHDISLYSFKHALRNPRYQKPARLQIVSSIISKNKVRNANNFQAINRDLHFFRPSQVIHAIMQLVGRPTALMITT